MFLLRVLCLFCLLFGFVLAGCDPVNDEYNCLGTAQAPTTSGGACTNTEDYAIWTVNNGSGDGYSKFQNDLKVCTSYCKVQDVYSCGFLGTGYCCAGSSNAKMMLCCVRDCLRWTADPRGDARPTYGNGGTPNPGFTWSFPSGSVRKIGGPPAVFSDACATCFANVSVCTNNHCLLECTVGGGEDSAACADCVVRFCDDAFMKCSGLNIKRRPSAAFNLNALLGGALGGCGALFVIAVFFGWRKVQRDSEKRHLDFENLAELAKRQSVFNNNNNLAGNPPRMIRVASLKSEKAAGHQAVVSFVEPPAALKLNVVSPMKSNHDQEKHHQHGEHLHAHHHPHGLSLHKHDDYNVLDFSAVLPNNNQQKPQQQPNNTTNPAYANGEKTVYQLKYEKQQNLLAKGLDPTDSSFRSLSSIARPSARMSTLAAQAIRFGADGIHSRGKVTHLVALWDFFGENPDELKVKVGTKLVGFEEHEQWWLAKTEFGVIGLIPSNYVEADARFSMKDPTESRSFEPEF